MMKEFLRPHIEKICPLTDAEFEYISSRFVERKIKKHQFLIQEGTSVTHDYLVVKGCLRAYYTGQDGKEHILQFATENWWVTDYRAYFNILPALIYVDCLEDCELLAISLHDREMLCAEMHKMEHFYRKKSNAGYVALQGRILSLLMANPQERYQQFVNQYPQLSQRISKQYIAAYLGVSRETLSRLPVK